MNGQTLALKKVKILEMVDAQARRDCIEEIDRDDLQTSLRQMCSSLVNGVVKLGDLSVGRFFTSKTTVAHLPIATRHYMSPEFIQEDGYTFKSDVWSLGRVV